MTQTSGRSARSVARTVSRSVSASTGTSSAPPVAGVSRSARRRICAADSSPETYSVRRPAAARLPSAMFVSVDLPIPGEPPSSTSEPGTRPPPSTRSSSPIAGQQARHALGADVGEAHRAGRARRRARAPPRAARARAPAGARRALLDERVPRVAARALPVPARAASARSAEQTWIVAGRAMPARLGRGPRRLRPLRPGASTSPAGGCSSSQPAAAALPRVRRRRDPRRPPAARSRRARRACGRSTSTGPAKRHGSGNWSPTEAWATHSTRRRLSGEMTSGRPRVHGFVGSSSRSTRTRIAQGVSPSR